MVAPINYSTSNPVILSASTPNPQTLPQNLATLTISSHLKPVTEHVLIIGEDGNQHI